MPESDVHFLGRVNFGHVINDTTYANDPHRDTGKGGFFKHSLGYLSGLSASLHLTYHEAGFVQMLLIDSNSFNRNTYNFLFVRNDFLGTIPTVVFDVQPSRRGSTGRFAGRIWVERNSGNIVRFNGNFAGSQKDIAGVLPLRLLADQRAGRPLASYLGLHRGKRSQEPDFNAALQSH